MREMKLQFELLDKLYQMTKESNTKISKLKTAINQELSKVKREISTLYDENEDELYLVQFDKYSIDIHKVTKDKLHTIHLTWFDSKKYIAVPKHVEDAMNVFRTIESDIPPTNAEIYSYMEFGYFDDIKDTYSRQDWITEQTYEKRFLFTVDKIIFNRMMHVVLNHYVQ